MKNAIREMSVGEVFDQSIKLMQEKIGLILGILACLQIPVGIIGGILIAFSMPDFENATMEEMSRAMERLSQLTMVLGLVNLLVFPITQAAIIHAISKSYLGEPVTVGECYSQALKRFMPLLLTYILVYLVVIVGFILLIIPGIIFSLWYSMAGPVVVIENTSGGAAMGRSKELASGNLASLFALFFLIGIINGAIGVGFEYLPAPLILNQIAGQILSSLLMAFAATALVLFYFSCRCKKEGFDLEVLAKSFGDYSQKPDFSRSGFAEQQFGGQQFGGQQFGEQPGNSPSDPQNPYS